MANDSYPYRFGRTVRDMFEEQRRRSKDLVDTAGQNIRSNVKPIEDAASGFSEGISEKPVEKDYVGEYLARNPGMAQEFARSIGPARDPAKTYEPHPQTNITAPAVAANMLRQKSQEEQAQRRSAEARTIRQMPDGSFTNQGNEGTVVMRNGESVGPDIGAPGRGGLSMDTSDEARRNYENNLYGGSPEDRRKLEEDRAATRYAEIIQRNPFAREMFQAQIRQQQQESEAQNAYATARAKGQAEQDTRSALLGQQAELENYAEQERQTMRQDPRYLRLSPEERAQKEAEIDRWLSGEKMRLGIPNDAEWGRLG
jgi:hypothetical protein